MKLAILQIPSIIAVLTAGYCAVNKIEGWGWFLFAALVLAPGSWVMAAQAQESE